MPESIPREMLMGFGLTTAHIFYHLPDNPALLQEFLWQHTDLAPRFPRLLTFLDFWQNKIEGELHSITVAHTLLIRPREIPIVGGRLVLH